MRTPLIIAAISVALSTTSAFAQTAPAEPRFSAEAVRAHVEFLADDQLEGRDAGTRGYDLAALYVATRFRALGLVPAGENGSWYQMVTLSRYELDSAKPAHITINGKRFENGKDVLIGASPRFPGTQSVTGNAVYVGAGLYAPDLGLDDYKGLDLKGKLVVMTIGLHKGVPAPRAQALAEARAKEAADRGAVGIFFLVSPEDLKKFPWPMAARYFTRPQTGLLNPDGTPMGSSDPRLQIGGYLNAEAAKAMLEGAPKTADALFAELAQGTATAGFALVPKVLAERTSIVKTMKAPNVIGKLPGSDPKLAGEHVLLTAHLDHDGKDESLTGDQIYNGAMDNAVGVSTMLEAARGFVEGGIRPKRPILFAALAAEEDGLLGSQYLAKYPVTGTGKVIADVNLDMPVLLYDFQDVVAFGAEHSTLGPIVERAAAKAGVTLSPDPMPEENLFVRSDHYSFVKAGVPSVFLVTGFKNGGEKAFRDFLATNYHKPSDQVTLPFNWQAGAKFARINYLIAREIADGAQVPMWYEGNEYGDQFAKDAPKAKKPAAPATARAPAAKPAPAAK